MNDCLRTNVFVRFDAETIACACIYLAARVLQVGRALFDTMRVFLRLKVKKIALLGGRH